MAMSAAQAMNSAAKTARGGGRMRGNGITADDFLTSSSPAPRERLTPPLEADVAAALGRAARRVARLPRGPARQEREKAPGPGCGRGAAARGIIDAPKRLWLRP